MAKKKFKLDKHVLIPKHAKVSETEKKKVLEKYNISLAELPKIPRTDAAIASLDVKAGDMIKIVRSSATSNESIFYRVVVNV